MPIADHHQHTYATLSPDSGVHAKIASDRIGHAHEGITVQITGIAPPGTIGRRPSWWRVYCGPGWTTPDSPPVTDLVTNMTKRPTG